VEQKQFYSETNLCHSKAILVQRSVSETTLSHSKAILVQRSVSEICEILFSLANFHIPKCSKSVSIKTFLQPFLKSPTHGKPKHLKKSSVPFNVNQI